MGGSQVFLEEGEVQTVDTLIKCIAIASARDVAIMSRALIEGYPQIYDYTKIWMEDIVHNTRRGSSVFTLTSTNKLLRQYPVQFLCKGSKI